VDDAEDASTVAMTGQQCQQGIAADHASGVLWVLALMHA
jgi:hypothetical protein